MDEEEDFVYEEISLDKFQLAPDEGDEDITLEALQAAVKTQPKIPTLPTRSEQPPVTSKPVIVEDYIRNYLKKMKMEKTLDMFQTEWYEYAHESTTDPVVDAYSQIQELTEQVFRLKEELQAKTEFAEKASGLFEKLRKERDFHKMHHRRVVEEKNKLIRDLKRLVKHNANYEPALREMKNRYEAVMKDKMLLKLEKDKYLNRVEILEETVRQLQSYPGATTGAGATLASSVLASSPLGREGDGGSRVLQPTASTLHRQRETAEKHGLKFTEGVGVTTSRFGGTGRSGKMGRAESRERVRAPPALNVTALPRPTTPPSLPAPATKAGSFKATKTLNCHSQPITSLRLHRKRDYVVTTSDDTTWKLWNISSGDLVMSGDGHKDWVSTSDFHALGSKIATGSGDCTVRIWDIMSASCSATLSDHTGPVWSVSFMDHGDFLSSASSDTTIKLWDVSKLQCVYTLRGHVDSVNDASFLPNTTLLCSASADKTVSLWDVRMGACAQTFYGHTNVCSKVTYDYDGSSLASSDADGVVCLWDTRMVQQRARFNCGPRSANGVSFDGSGKILAVGSDDGTVRIINIDEESAKLGATALNRTTASTAASLPPISRLPQVTKALKAHTDQVLDVVFDQQNKFLLSCSADRTMIVWC